MQRARERTKQETPANIADRARDSEDDSFADLIVHTNLAEMDRDVDELRMIDSALQRISRARMASARMRAAHCDGSAGSGADGGTLR